MVGNSPKNVIRPSDSSLGAPCKKHKLLPGIQSIASHASSWQSLGLDGEELRLEFTLKTGQSFRWRKMGEGKGSYVGVIRDLVVECVQDESDVKWRVVGRRQGERGGDGEQERLLVEDYFNLQAPSLRKLRSEWSQRDKEFAAVAPFLPGARTLRQDPVECLFSFICSSNNHISRIQGMVEKLCSTYGTPLKLDNGVEAIPLPEVAFYAFPSLAQLSLATEEELRDLGFGYRAKFIVGATSLLNSLPEGQEGAAWLMGLRSRPLPEVIEQLNLLPGVGPKVASCVALFSIDKADAVPVDTHVWDIACRHYTPHLRGKTLTPKLHPQIQAAFQSALGEYCGWAHNALFISELKSYKKEHPKG